MRVTAPGKLMIAGEYAVLDGAQCVVAAVDARVVVETCEQDDVLPIEVVSTRSIAAERLGLALGALKVNADALRSGTTKLGLGSSAALAAATAGAAYASAGADLRDEDVRRKAFSLALEGHASVAPQGSGADVAASVFGGVLAYAMGGECQPLSASVPGLMRVAWTGKEARTHALVASVRAYKEASTLRYDACIRRIADACARMKHAIESSALDEFLGAVNEHHRASAELGSLVGAPIVEERLELVSKLACAAGGAAKGSGAGGGDVALAFFRDESSALRFDESCEKKAIQILSLQFSALGVSSL